MDVYDRIQALGLENPFPTSKDRIFVPAMKMGEKIYVTSGNNCKVNGKLPHSGKPGAEAGRCARSAVGANTGFRFFRVQA